LILLFIFCSILTITIQSQKLIFKKDKTFKILQFTDLHFGENDFSDYASLLQQEKLLELEKPDLVVLSGDAVSGHRTKEFEKSYHKLIQPMLKNVRKLKKIFKRIRK